MNREHSSGVMPLVTDTTYESNPLVSVVFYLLINQSINQVYFQINMYKNEQKVHISQIDRKKVEVEVSNLEQIKPSNHFDILH